MTCTVEITAYLTIVMVGHIGELAIVRESAAWIVQSKGSFLTSSPCFSSGLNADFPRLLFHE